MKIIVKCSTKVDDLPPKLDPFKSLGDDAHGTDKVLSSILRPNRNFIVRWIKIRRLRVTGSRHF